MFKPHVTVACVVHAAGKFWWSKRPSTAKRCGTSRPATSRPTRRWYRLPNASCGKRQASAPRLRRSCACTSGSRRIARRSCVLLRYRAGTAAADRAARQRHRSLPVAERRRDFAGAQPAFRTGGGEHSQLPAAGALPAVAGRQLRLAVLGRRAAQDEQCAGAANVVKSCACFISTVRVQVREIPMSDNSQKK